MYSSFLGLTHSFIFLSEVFFLDYELEISLLSCSKKMLSINFTMKSFSYHLGDYEPKGSMNSVMLAMISQ